MRFLPALVAFVLVALLIGIGLLVSMRLPRAHATRRVSICARRARRTQPPPV